MNIHYSKPSAKLEEIILEKPYPLGGKEQRMENEILSVLCYTREPLEPEIYSPKLAYSMHLAYTEDGMSYRELNHNSGVLFAKAAELSNATLSAKSLKNPYLFHMADGNFGVLAIRTEADGSPDQQSKGSVLLFTSPDLLQYRELGLLNLTNGLHVQDIMCEYEHASRRYILRWREEDGRYYQREMADVTCPDDAAKPKPCEAFTLSPRRVDIEGAVPRNAIRVSRGVAQRLIHKLTVPVHVRNELPERVAVTSKEQLQAVKVTAIYSDGTTTIKPIEWDASEIDWSRPGTYRISGSIRQDRYTFPMATNRADPCIAQWDGRYYFVATNDADGNHTISIREADSIFGLVSAEETKILDTGMHDHLKRFLWAPELHGIGGDLYIFLAGCSGEFKDIQSHVMRLKNGGNPRMAADWGTPIRVARNDGSPLFQAGITLDMTVLERKGRLYVLWAQRELVPHDLGSWIYIAEADPREPWRLLSEPVLLSKPDYGWANNQTFVEEGPFALMTDRKIFVTISGALVDATYCVGMLSVNSDADLLDPNQWTKRNYPLLTSRSVPGEYGPGHNSYVKDEEGTIWSVYHARPGIGQPRCSGLRRVHFDVDGEPMLGLTEEKDLNPALASVYLDVQVEALVED
ncbi:family 43 glycosylhydrolase [Bacillus sp. FSL K6-6540]|uniref:family 43 glycosylhydrolase n=1 Tax=Bacillus sp. FSL K6-6540 TaxID=2921512 RepID=UPI0030FCCAC3